MTAHAELLAAGSTTRAAANLCGVPRATAARAKARTASNATPVLPAVAAPANRLSAAERAHVLAVLNSQRVRRRTTGSGVRAAAGGGQLPVLGRHDVPDPGGQRPGQGTPPARAAPRTGRSRAGRERPGQVFTWDITKLPGPTKGAYYDAYVMIDIYSRYIVGVHVHAAESGLLAKEMMQQIFGDPRHPAGRARRPRHLDDLQDRRGSAGRPGRDPVPFPAPKVSNDNPYSEAWFKTLKYAPVFPQRFGSLAHARGFMDEFVQTLQPRAPPHAASGCTPPPTSTTASPQPGPPPAARSWPTPELLTPSGSPPTPTPRSSPCLEPRGSTNPNPSKHQRLNTHWPQPP